MTEELTFAKHDKFQREYFADRLTKVLVNFSPLHHESYVLSLNAKFGSGKTTFLQMWKSKLIAKNYKVIYINAWETDFDDEPIIPILSSIYESIKDDKQTAETANAIKASLGIVGYLGNQLIKHQTGIDVEEAKNKISDKIEQKELESEGFKIYEEFSYKNKVFKTLKESLEKFVEKLESKPLIIFVDELDRVRPNYCIAFLETIKHLFPVRNICFVLAADRTQLKESIRQLYGNIDFENYYLRFVTRETNLPIAKNFVLKPFLEEQLSSYFKELNQTQHLPIHTDDRTAVNNFMGLIANSFSFTPRQCETMVRQFVQIIAISSHERFSQRTYLEALLFLIAVFMTDQEFYKKLGQDTLSFKEFNSYLNKLYVGIAGSDNDKNHVCSIAYACFLRESVNNQFTEIAIAYRNLNSKENIQSLSKEDTENTIDRLTRYTNQYGQLDSASVFAFIYNLIEQWNEFL